MLHKQRIQVLDISVIELTAVLQEQQSGKYFLDEAKLPQGCGADVECTFEMSFQGEVKKRNRNPIYKDIYYCDLDEQDLSLKLKVRGGIPL